MHTITADKQKRVRIPDAKPGQVFAYEADGDRITLTAVKKSQVKERPYDPHLYDNLSQEEIDLEAATAKWAAGPDADRE